MGFPPQSFFPKYSHLILVAAYLVLTVRGWRGGWGGDARDQRGASRALISTSVTTAYFSTCVLRQVSIHFSGGCGGATLDHPGACEFVLVFRALRQHLISHRRTQAARDASVHVRG